MALSKNYNPNDVEPRLSAAWQEAGIYHFDPLAEKPVYSIDTPPATVSGHLHLGHVYSYTHPDLVARFWRMRGFNVFYPMGFDDNGLPTERLVEKQLGKTAAQVGRQAFIEKCLQVSEEAQVDYQALWKRLGLSIDWRYTYRTIDERSRRTSQLSFIELYQKGLAYRREAPAIWCPECRTAIAQAELNDMERESEFVVLPFPLSPIPLEKEGDRGLGAKGSSASNNEESSILIATTRPELLPACVAIFIHPADPRARDLAGRKAIVPLFGQQVPILTDPGADPQKGTGAVMCCTFGDSADVTWWYTHKLPRVEAVDRQGQMTGAAGNFAALPLIEARHRIKKALEEAGLLVGRQAVLQTVRVHERCDTPVEYIITRQWFIRVLDFKDTFLKAGQEITWHPEHMRARYQDWVENLNWDWCISRQRYFGVPIPVWYCKECGEVILAGEGQLPVDPAIHQPDHPCSCGSTEFIPEEDVFDTWATSSMSPQIVGKWLPERETAPGTDERDGSLFKKVFPFSLRPQGKEIIRTWAFYTIVKSRFHCDSLPWKEVLISGWGIAGEGMGKISKSRGGGPLPPLEMIARYSADAVRYWAASTGAGRDAVISEEKIQAGARLVTKLWNVARFCERFLVGFTPLVREKGNRGIGDQGLDPDPAPLSPNPLTPYPLSIADRWILSRLQRLIRRVTALMESYDYATAKSEIEGFFWTELADNYLEMCKQRLYDEANPRRDGARFTLRRLLEDLLKLFAPFLPYVTEEIYQGIFAGEKPGRGSPSIHTALWPEADPALEDDHAEAAGQVLVSIATTVRRYKSEHNLSLGAELDRLQLAIAKDDQDKPVLDAQDLLAEAFGDLKSVTRVRQIELVDHLNPSYEPLISGNSIQIAVEPAR